MLFLVDGLADSRTKIANLVVPLNYYVNLCGFSAVVVLVK